MDLTSLRFGRLVVEGLAGQDHYGHARWKCRCDCGKEVVSLSSNLRGGHTVSCGCLRAEYEDLTGKEYDRLKVVGVDDRRGRRWFWNCRCSCGKNVVVCGDDLKSGHTRSCGCRALEVGRLDKKHEDFTGRKIGRLTIFGEARRVGSKRYWRCQCECGNIVEVLSGHLRGSTFSCGCLSRDVARKTMSDTQKRRREMGLHGNRWKPELSMEDRALHGNRDYFPQTHEWRSSVYRRDGWRCCVCGYKGKKIVAHHKESWNDHKVLRFDVGNGETVCQPCHKEFHSRYGYGNNTAVQWAEFVASKRLARAVA